MWAWDLGASGRGGGTLTPGLSWRLPAPRRLQACSTGLGIRGVAPKPQFSALVARCENVRRMAIALVLNSYLRPRGVRAEPPNSSPPQPMPLLHRMRLLRSTRRSPPGRSRLAGQRHPDAAGHQVGRARDRERPGR